MTGGASTGGAQTFTNVTATTAAVENVITATSNSTGTTAANFGPRIRLQGESTTTDNQDMGGIGAIWTTATHASRTSAIPIYGVNNAGALGEFARFSGATAPELRIASAVGTPGTTTYGNAGITVGTSFTLGGSASNVTIGANSGQVILQSTINLQDAIRLFQSINGASSVGGINIGSAMACVQTSGTRNYITYDLGFAPTSGTAIHNQFSFTGTLNQTGGANGIARGINLAHIMTAVADYRAIEIADNHANAKGIYQTGALTTNNFVGRTTFGDTSVPDASSALEVKSTTTGLLFPRMTTAQRDAIASATDGLVIYNTTDTKLQVRAGGAWVNLH